MRTRTAVKQCSICFFGSWGKVGINCFVLITGYFMCQSETSVKKFLKLYLEVVFYNLAVMLFFAIVNYEKLSLKFLLRAFLPFLDIDKGFIECYLWFYLLIPYLSILIKNMKQKQYSRLLGILLFIYTILGSVPKLKSSFNYVTWFIVVYFLGAYIRLYGEQVAIFKKHVGAKFALSLAVSVTNIIIGVVWHERLLGPVGKDAWYFWLSDSNKILAVILSVYAFIWFKNLKLPNLKFINIVAASTFGVLMIHANSGTMRQWLWGDLLHNVDMYGSEWMVLHAFLSVVAIYAVCTVIDIGRIYFLERPFFKLYDKWQKH